MRITVPRIRIAPRPMILVTLLIRPACNTDNAKFYETAKTYSALFEVVGNLLQDHLTKLLPVGLTESRGTNEGSR